MAASSVTGRCRGGSTGGACQTRSANAGRCRASAATKAAARWEATALQGDGSHANTMSFAEVADAPESEI